MRHTIVSFLTLCSLPVVPVFGTNLAKRVQSAARPHPNGVFVSKGISTYNPAQLEKWFAHLGLRHSSQQQWSVIEKGVARYMFGRTIQSSSFETAIADSKNELRAAVEKGRKTALSAGVPFADTHNDRLVAQVRGVFAAKASKSDQEHNKAHMAYLTKMFYMIIDSVSDELKVWLQGAHIEKDESGGAVDPHKVFFLKTVPVVFKEAITQGVLEEKSTS